MTFVLAPARLVKGENAWDEYREIYLALQNAAISRGESIWPGYKFGGVVPDAGMFGLAQLRPPDVFGGGTATWNKRYGSQGSWAPIWSYTVPRDEIHAYAGISITDPTLIFSSLRWTVEDRIYPVTNIEEAHLYPGGFSIVFKQDEGKELVISELKGVLLEGFLERGTGGRQQRVVPIGFMLYRAKALAINKKETGN